MSCERPQSVGWYLGLRFMHGEGVIAKAPEKRKGKPQKASFFYADDVLLLAEDWREILEDWWEGLAVQGAMILWVSDCRFRAVEGAARIVLQDLLDFFEARVGWTLQEADVIEGHAFVVVQKRDDELCVRKPWRKAARHLLVARLGALGDALMASSVLPALKKERWRISFLSKGGGAEVLRANPFIDEMIVLGEGQVSDAEMPDYLSAWERRFDRFINLSHSVEGDLLKLPMRGDYFWSARQRRALCDTSYLARTHALAEVPPPYEEKFYARCEEKVWALSVREKIGPFILWSLRGSAVHKWWPYAPEAVCRLLAKTDLKIVLTGGEDAKDLAEDVERAVARFNGDQERVLHFVGTHSVREIMALAALAQVVVGPETGVLHAVSFLPMPKIVMLSHSSRRNLTDDWVNTKALEACVTCAPCHRLHFDHSWCPVDQATGAAACAAAITADEVVEAVLSAVDEKTKGEEAC